MKMFSGPKREEHMIAFQNADDSFTHYDGPKGEERAWLKVMTRTGTAQVVSTANGRITHSILMDGKVLFHSRNGERVTHAPAAKFQKVKKELNSALQQVLHRARRRQVRAGRVEPRERGRGRVGGGGGG